jgi:hypothetical protein
MKATIFTFGIGLLLAVMLMGCNQQQREAAKEQGREVFDSLMVGPQPNKTIEIGAFTTFPEEITGCSCYVTADSTTYKNGEYIFMSDMAEVAYMKLDGEMVRFTREKEPEIKEATHTTDYHSEEYDITVEMTHGMRTGYEVWNVYGLIQVNDREGNSTATEFFGECGC